MDSAVAGVPATAMQNLKCKPLKSSLARSLKTSGACREGSHSKAGAAEEGGGREVHGRERSRLL